jgi:hypothetical protein
MSNQEDSVLASKDLELVHWTNISSEFFVIGGTYKCDTKLCAHLHLDWSWPGKTKVVIRVPKDTRIQPVPKYDFEEENKKDGECAPPIAERHTEVRLFPGQYTVTNVVTKETDKDGNSIQLGTEENTFSDSQMKKWYADFVENHPNERRFTIPEIQEKLRAFKPSLVYVNYSLLNE